MQASLELCSRCVCLLQQRGDRGCRLLLAQNAHASTGDRRKTVGSFLRWKSSSRKAKKDEEHCKAATEGNNSSPVYFPLEGRASKPDYRVAGAVPPLSIDAESHRSSGAGRFYLHRSEGGGLVELPSVTTSGCAPDHVINDASDSPNMSLTMCANTSVHWQYG